MCVTLTGGFFVSAPSPPAFRGYSREAKCVVPAGSFGAIAFSSTKRDDVFGFFASLSSPELASGFFFFVYGVASLVDAHERPAVQRAAVHRFALRLLDRGESFFLVEAEGHRQRAAGEERRVHRALEAVDELRRRAVVHHVLTEDVLDALPERAQIRRVTAA